MSAARLVGLFAELKRRHVFRVAAVYAAAAFIVWQVAAIAFPALQLPGWSVTLVVVLAILGFPLALVLAWAFDLEPRPEPVRWERIEEVLNDAIELPARERAAYLDRACDGQPSVRREVESLLEAHERPGPLDRPVAERAAPLLDAVHTADLEPGSTIRQYRIVERLGRGGMGVVYKAEDRKLGRTVALKFLPPHLNADPQAKERLLVEARAAASLDHPGICTIHEIGESEQGQLFIAMPYYGGETLKARIADGPLAVDEAVSLTIQIAHGLDRAHASGVVHRDIKPANLVVVPSGGIKILDFGIAKLADVSLTRPGSTPGTVAYMSPEQARGEPVDARTDVWSLGVVLYEMLTGERPFRGSHDQVVLHAIQNTDPEPVTARRAGIDPGVARVVQRALSRERALRFGSAGEMALELERARGNGGPVLAAAPDAIVSVPGAVGQSGEAAVSDLSTNGGLPDSERRQATIVASTLSGYAELVERLVPAEVDAILDRLRCAADETARRHGGTLNHFGGEEMVLLFGVPTAHEDDAQRAVRAALELHGRVHELGEELGEHAGQRVRLHTGIDCGRVVAQPTDGRGGAFRVAGAAAGTAAQLAAHAAADEIWVGPDCRRLIGPYFDTVPREPLAVRGREEPLRPFHVTGESGVQTRLEAAERAGLTRYVGREAEMESLRRCLDAAVRGEGQYVAVVGEAGIGKSRLLLEFQHRLEAEPVTVLRGRCQSFGAGTSYLPFIDVLRGGLHLGEPDASGDGIDSSVTRIRQIGEELEEFIPLYLHLLSTPSERFPVPRHLHGDQFRLAMQDALAAIMTLAARRRPTVILLEDWHWADDASRAVLQQVVEMTPDYPLMVVVTSRPGHAALGTERGVATSILLHPLEPADSRTVLQAVLGADSVPDPLVAMVHERAGGNPFFLEEICHTLLEEEALRVDDGRVVLTGSPEELELPDSIHGVIRARLDRLDRDAREAVRVASVVGREFTRGVLAHALPQVGRLPNALQTLKVAGLIHQTRVVPEAAYRFKHVLTQEVAYAGLLEHQRKEMHGRVAEAIETLHGTRLEEHLDRLAHHFARAERWLEAVPYGLRAAERASELSQFSEALRLVERVRGWLSHLPEGTDRRELLCRALLHEERLCESLGLRGRQQEIIDALVEVVTPGDDPARLAEVHVRQGDLYTLLRRFDEAETALHRSLELYRGLEDRVGERNTLRSLGLLRWHEDRNAEALECIEQALTISRERDDPEALLGDLSNFGNVLKAIGEYERARGYLEEALALAESMHEQLPEGIAIFKQAYILHNLANVHRELGQNEQALEYLHSAVELTSGERLPIQLSYHYTAIAHILLQEGRIEECLQHYHEAVALERRAQYALGLSQALRILGEVLVGLGRHGEALPHLEEAAELFARLQDRETEAATWGRIAGVHERREAHADALAAWSRVRTLRRRTGDRRGEMEALEGMARVTRRHVDEPSLALGYYREALELATELGERATEGRLGNTVGILEWTQGNYEEALVCYRRAVGVFEELDDAANAGLMRNSIGVTLKALGRREEARSQLEEAVARHVATGQPLLQGHALAALGEIHHEVGDTGRALECYRDSLRLRRQVGDRRGEGWMLHHLAQVHLDRELPGEARGLIDEAARIAAEIADDELESALERLRRGSAL